jgi:phytoene dehydrogenase-like protein
MPTKSQDKYDVIVIGAGHNGLTCAGYLSRAGYRVKVVERRHVVGGAAVTEEFHPGFRNSVCSYVVSLLDPMIIRDLQLQSHGLTILERPAGSLSVLPDGQYLQVSRDVAVARSEIAKFSGKDADAYDAFDREITGMAEVLREVTREAPPNMGGGLRDVWTALKLGNRLRKLTPQQQGTFAELMTMSIGDYLDRWFESDPVKGDFGFEGIVGNMVSPYQAGTAYVLLHHAFGEINGRTGVWGHARGGMGAITQAMARSAEAHGADIEVCAPVRELIIREGQARGVVLEDGRSLQATVVSGNVNPKLLFLKMMDPNLLPEDFRRRMTGWRCRSGTFRMNVALSELPRFTCLNSIGDQSDYESRLTGTVNIAPSLAYLEQAFDDAKAGAWAREPVISMCLPSLVDDSLAPAGCHVMSLFCQHFNPQLSEGRSWDDVKEEVADLVVQTVTNYAPNFRQAVLGRQVLSPLDLEREFGLVGGDIFHGALHLDQLYSLRPAAGYADYRSPVKGLYLCGSGAHPGGGVSGLPGHHAARAIIRDLKQGRVAA